MYVRDLSCNVHQIVLVVVIVPFPRNEEEHTLTYSRVMSTHMNVCNEDFIQS